MIDEIQRIFYQAPFIKGLGMELLEVLQSQCVTRFEVKERFLQQDGFVHAGVVATLADHTAGCAASTVIAKNQIVLTAEFKINLLRASIGPVLICESKVIKSGRTLIICESNVYQASSLPSSEKSLSLMVAKALVTLVCVEKRTD